MKEEVFLSPKKSNFWLRPAGNGSHLGRTVAVVVWPGRLASGELRICDKYMPETVGTFEELRERAEIYGCLKPLESKLKSVRQCLEGAKKFETYPLLVFLVARRPFNLIGATSELELCPYVLEVGRESSWYGSKSEVRPAGLLEDVSQRLLEEVSDVEAGEKPFNWTLLGAGSLGSKVAIHLARSGRGPAKIIDGSDLRPHNVARHALLPVRRAGVDFGMNWSGSKAENLAQSITSLDQGAEGKNIDVIEILSDDKHSRWWLSKNIDLIVNATASVAVREALASAGCDKKIARILDIAWFAKGNVALWTLEGGDRNPNTGELIAEAYRMMQEDSDIVRLFRGGQSDLEGVVIGQGCSSRSMRVSDSRLSISAAAISNELLRLQKHGLPEQGLILLGKLSGDRIQNLNWSAREVPEFERFRTANSAYSVSISAAVQEQILEEIEKWPGKETGGVVIGRYSEFAKTFYIVDLIEAPEDSERFPNRFVLGKKGLKRKIESYSGKTRSALYSLGSWHSHLGSSKPSTTDRDTARVLDIARVLPAVLIIRGTDGFSAITERG